MTWEMCKKVLVLLKPYACSLTLTQLVCGWAWAFKRNDLEPVTVQLNLNLTITRMWHTTFWTNFSCHSWVTREQIIKIYIHTHVTLELLDKLLGHSWVAHKVWTNLSCYSQIACEYWTNLLSLLRVALKHTIWCTREVCYLRGMYYVTCKMHVW